MKTEDRAAIDGMMRLARAGDYDGLLIAAVEMVSELRDSEEWWFRSYLKAIGTATGDDTPWTNTTSDSLTPRNAAQ